MQRKFKKQKMMQNVFIKSKIIKLCSYRPRLHKNRCIKRKFSLRQGSEKFSDKKAKLANSNRDRIDLRHLRGNESENGLKDWLRSMVMRMRRLK